VKLNPAIIQRSAGARSKATWMMMTAMGNAEGINRAWQRMRQDRAHCSDDQHQNIKKQSQPLGFRNADKNRQQRQVKTSEYRSGIIRRIQIFRFWPSFAAQEGAADQILDRQCDLGENKPDDRAIGHRPDERRACHDERER